VDKTHRRALSAKELYRRISLLIRPPWGTARWSVQQPKEIAMLTQARHRRAAAFALLFSLCVLPAHADEPVVLKNKDVTESALIDALNVQPPRAAQLAKEVESAASAPGKTRGFKPAAPTAMAVAAAAPTQPAGPGRANLLIVFDTNSATLTPDSQQALDTVALALQSNTLVGQSFRVEGHADSRGDAEANRKLSQSRAESVVAYLVGKHGLQAARLTAQGKGSSEPLNKERADAPENRRVTIITNRS
jgi:outer membrane protein OmpA-like peptidoglycan-associated protein